MCLCLREAIKGFQYRVTFVVTYTHGKATKRRVNLPLGQHMRACAAEVMTCKADAEFLSAVMREIVPLPQQLNTFHKMQ